MIDPSEMETTAMGACLHPLGEFVGGIGMDRPLASYSRLEVLTLIDVVVTAYQGQMTAEHERMAEGACVMLDFNARPKIQEQISQLIDAALTRERAGQTPRDYLGASRLGVSCERALQYEYTHTPVDDGRDFSGRLLRIFEVGHTLEDLAIRWLRMAGFDLYTRKVQGGQFGFSVAGGRIRGHVDGILNTGPADLGVSYPALWEFKTMNDKSWRDTVKLGVAKSKPVYAAQVAVYQAYMEASIPGISANPALFTAINKDTQEIWFELLPFDGGLAQRMSDRAVRVITATSASEVLPRFATTPTHMECKFCAWQDRCWGTQ